MKIVAISWVRNEADIIEAFVRHHCGVADRMIVVDNGSIDNTLELLQSLQREGLPLEIRSDAATGHRQSEAMTTLVEELRADPPDWILPLDADEFIVCTGCGDIRSALQQQNTNAIALLPWRSYVPTPGDPDAGPVLRRIRHRKTAESPQWYKVAIPKSALSVPVILSLGNHALLRKDTGKDAAYVTAKGIALAHFPVRSPKQIAAKVLAGWPRHLTDPQRAPDASFQWKVLFDELRTGALLTPDQLQQCAIEYATYAQWSAFPWAWNSRRNLVDPTTSPETHAHDRKAIVLDPVPCTFHLRYRGSQRHPMEVLAETAERLALEVAQLRGRRYATDPSSFVSMLPLHHEDSSASPNVLGDHNIF